MNIGIAISTHDRREIADHSIAEWRRFLPVGAKLVIVDDASVVPYPDADYRFDQHAGIAIVKNKCLQLLEDCDHIFCVDDDIYPVREGWELPYTSSTLVHACYIFQRRKLWTEPTYIAYDLPRGCMLYFNKYCLKVAGGFDTRFKIYGYDHAELSRRIFNMGLTPARYVDVPGSERLFYSHDEQFTAQSSLPTVERTEYVRQNKGLFNQTFFSNQFVPYK